MTRLLLALICFGVLSISASGQNEVRSADETRAVFERVATDMPYLSTRTVLHDRPDDVAQYLRAPGGEQYATCYREVTDDRHMVESVVPLLEHADAKVRTLALIALFDREDAKLLPHIYTLHNDRAETFGSCDYWFNYANPMFVNIEKHPPARQMVGTVARDMLRFYPGLSVGYLDPEDEVKPPVIPGAVPTVKSPPDDPVLKQAFEEYWALRKDRDFCAGWFSVQLRRAVQSGSPVPLERLPRVAAVRRKVESLPDEDAAWTLLWLRATTIGHSLLTTDEEIVERLKRIGPERLLRFLRFDATSDDPDVQVSMKRNENYDYGSAIGFVLRNADELFRQKDSDELLRIEAWHADFEAHGIPGWVKSPWWAIAAARLNPARASEILRVAAADRDRVSLDVSRAQVMAALWELCGDAEKSLLVDWFFNELPNQGSMPGGRGLFVQQIRETEGAARLLSEIIRDPRLETLDWMTLKELVEAVNYQLTQPIVTADELRKLSHPFGPAHFHRQEKEAEEQFPRETAKVRATLNEWRKRLRGAASQLLDRFTP